MKLLRVISTQGTYASDIAASHFSTLSQLGFDTVEAMATYPPASFLFQSAQMTSLVTPAIPMANIKRQACPLTSQILSTTEAPPTTEARSTTETRPMTTDSSTTGSSTVASFTTPSIEVQIWRWNHQLLGKIIETSSFNIAAQSNIDEVLDVCLNIITSTGSAYLGVPLCPTKVITSTSNLATRARRSTSRTTRRRAELSRGPCQEASSLPQRCRVMAASACSAMSRVS